MAKLTIAFVYKKRHLISDINIPRVVKHIPVHEELIYAPEINLKNLQLIDIKFIDINGINTPFINVKVLRKIAHNIKHRWIAYHTEWNDINHA